MPSPNVGPVLQNPSKSKSKEFEQTQHLAPFTIKDLRDAVPAHCFERSLLKSLTYLVSDIVAISALLYIGHYFNSHISPNTSWPFAILFWSVMWFVQGAFMTGVWVVAHECGHQSFSKWKSVNDAFGLVLHSALLVPYHSWRITHGIHHKSTAHMDRDQVYVPKTYEQVTGESSDDVHNAISDSPLVNLLQIVILLTVGWPFYLITNAWGQNYGRRTNHFEPSAPMFKPNQKFEVMLSDAGLLVALAALTWCAMNYSVVSVLKFYFAPYLWVNFWLILITYLQHTDLRLPHYKGEEWNFVRGALSTIDRDYGIFNVLHHHIGDTHVAHHLFSQMPHYHAQEATAALRKVLGKYYLEDDTPIMKALWRSWNSCHYVNKKDSVAYYQTLPSKRNM